MSAYTTQVRPTETTQIEERIRSRVGTTIHIIIFIFKLFRLASMTFLLASTILLIRADYHASKIATILPIVIIVLILDLISCIFLIMGLLKSATQATYRILATLFLISAVLSLAVNKDKSQGLSIVIASLPIISLFKSMKSKSLAWLRPISIVTRPAPASTPLYYPTPVGVPMHTASPVYASPAPMYMHASPAPNMHIPVQQMHYTTSMSSTPSPHANYPQHPHMGQFPPSI